MNNYFKALLNDFEKRLLIAHFSFFGWFRVLSLYRLESTSDVFLQLVVGFLLIIIGNDVLFLLDQLIALVIPLGCLWLLVNLLIVKL